MTIFAIVSAYLHILNMI